MAEDGCSDIQYDLARQLLEENSETDPVGNDAQGVHWLLRAAQQGHEDALVMLRECYRDRRGITDSNECEVSSCLAMSSNERAARRAARELFACLSNGEEYITAAQLERKMREIYKLQKKRKGDSDDESDDNIERRNGFRASPPIHRLSRVDVAYPDVLTEANLVAAAVNYSNGYLPLVSRELSLSSPDPHILDNVPYFHRPLLHPLLFFTLLYHKFLNIMSSFPGTKFSNVQFFVILLSYSLFASDNLTQFVPVGTYYITLVIMIISSFKMLKSKQEFIDFRIWSGLFLSYGDERIDAETSEYQYTKNNTKPYLYFFVTFIINIMLHPLVLTDPLILHAEITVIAFALIFISMFAFMYSTNPFPDPLVLFSFGVNVLAKYPYEMDDVVTTGWRFLDLKVPTFSSFVIGNGIEFCLNCRTLLYLLIPGFLLYLAHRNKWRGIVRYVVPHCVTLSWLQICIVSSQCATMFGLVRAALGLAGILLFLPLFGIVTLLIPVFAVLEWLSLTDPTIRLVASIVAAIFALVGSCIMAANNRTEKYITVIQITVCVLATVFLTFPYMTSNFDVAHSRESKIYDDLMHEAKSEAEMDENTPTLTWPIYYKYCHQPAWEHINKIQSQLRCSQLDSTPIKWDGIVADVEISKINNMRSDIVKNFLPASIANFVRCFFGDYNKPSCSTLEECDDITNFLKTQNQCNFNKWNSYEYEITIRMPTSGIFKKPPEITLEASEVFGNFTMRITNSDRIWFRGILRNQQKHQHHSNKGIRLGKNRPIIELQSVGCISCSDLENLPIEVTKRYQINPRMRDLLRGVKYLLNVIFNPLLTFK